MGIICDADSIFKNKPLKTKDDHVYYFDNGFIYSKVSMAIAYKKGMFKGCIYMREDGSYFSGLSLNGFPFVNKKYSNSNIFNSALSKMQLGQTIYELKRNLDSVNFKHTNALKDGSVARFITKINNPSFEREPENFNVNTFDFIRVFVDTTCSTGCELSRSDFIKVNIKPISKMVLNKLETNKRFIKFGASSSFLKLTKVTMMCCDSIEFLFELK